MKKLYIALSFLSITFFAHGIDSYSDEATGKTFFSMRPHYTTGSPEHLSHYRDRMLIREEGVWGSLQATALVGQTTSSDSLARYFLPWHKQSIIVAEGPNPDPTAAVGGIYNGGSQNFKDGDYDILAHNFGIETEDRNFASRITFSPRQKFYGVAINYKQSISDDEDKGLWVDATLPIVHVENEMRMAETMLTTSVSVIPVAGAQKNMTEALNQAGWNYGKVCSGKQSKTGVDDFEIRIGRDTIRDEKYYRSSFLGIIVPAGTKPEGIYVFEPVVGNNRHWGLSWGGAAGFRIWNNKNSEIWVALDHRSHYLFERNETRSMDLKDKQWSRYINLFSSSQATATTPGINILTRELKIRPGGFFQTNTAFIFDHKRFRAEFGFNHYYSQHEDGELSCEWNEGPAIAGVNAAQGSTAAQSMSLADMHMWDYGLILHDVNLNSLAVDTSNNTARYKPIRQADLDISSALHPAVISSTIYASLGIHWDDVEYPPFASLGGLYEFSSSNATANKWEFWLKCGISI